MGIKADIERILDLQPLWDSKKTPEMDERGKLVRHGGPNWLRSFGDELAEAAGLPIDDLLIEGRDGTGPKTEVPWFRFASKQRSPSATMNWYCVYLFDTLGENAYLSLGHGSTDWTGVDFRAKPHEDLRALGAWGREAIAGISGERSDLSAVMELHSRRSDLGPAYEAGTAVCVRYGRDAIPSDDQLRNDALFFARLLRAAYRTADLEPEPVGLAPEITAIIEAAEQAAGRSLKRAGSKVSRSGGQGFRLSADQRSAIELRAMTVTRSFLETDGWEVEDTSSSRPYDFYCTNGDSEMYVEVKGTTSGGESVVLTRGEVEHHRSIFPANALAVVSGIRLVGESREEAEGGELRFISPWTIDDEQLTVVSYVYSIE